MKDFLAMIRNLTTEKVIPLEWPLALLLFLSIYVLGYICGILPFLFHRKRRMQQERSAALCEEILEKICEYDELYNRYVHEINPSEWAELERQVIEVRKSLVQLESRWATLEQREPRKLPLRPLPVRQMRIESVSG